MTIKSAAIQMYNNDDIYTLSLYFNPEATEDAAIKAEEYYENHQPENDSEYLELSDDSDISWEEFLAYKLRGEWGEIALRGWCDQFSREEMDTLLELLGRQTKSGVMPDLFLSAGKSVNLNTIRETWNKTHPDIKL